MSQPAFIRWSSEADIALWLLRAQAAPCSVPYYTPAQTHRVAYEILLGSAEPVPRVPVHTSQWPGEERQDSRLSYQVTSGTITPYLFFSWTSGFLFTMGMLVVV